MCGLFGIASTSLTKDEQNIFTQLGFLSAFRGIDSAGCFLVSRKDHKDKARINVMKQVTNPVSFMLSTQLSQKISEIRPCIMAGHARAATKGSVKLSNAHPFQVNGITGMHNGTIHSFVDSVLDRTDSEVLMEKIGTKGVDDALIDAHYGAYAIVYFDHAKRTLNIARNDQRPLFYMRSGGAVIAWASEHRMLEYVKSLNPSFKEAEIRSFGVGTLYSLKLGESVFTTRELTKKVFLPSTNTQADTKAPWDNTLFSCIPVFYARNTLENPIATVKGYPYERLPIKVVKTVEIKTVIHQTTTAAKKYKGYNDRRMTFETAKELLMEGCANCSVQPDVTDSVYWYDHNSFLCQECFGTPDAKTYFSYHRGFVKGEVVHDH